MPDTEEVTALQLEKARRENEKLELEIRALKRPAWKQASYIAAVFPVIAIVVTGWITGWITYSNSEFKKEADTARKQVSELAPQAAALRHQVDGLKSDRERLVREADGAKRSLTELRTTMANLTVQRDQLSKRLHSWRKEIQEINAVLSRVHSPVVTGSMFPPATAQVPPQQKRLQAILDEMAAVLQPKQ